jgi:hypothetical protein
MLDEKIKMRMELLQDQIENIEKIRVLHWWRKLTSKIQPLRSELALLLIFTIWILTIKELIEMQSN